MFLEKERTPKPPAEMVSQISIATEKMVPSGQNPGLLVTPPKGSQVGYVPIVTRQAARQEPDDPHGPRVDSGDQSPQSLLQYVSLFARMRT